MWYTKNNLRIAQTAGIGQTQYIGQNIEGSKSLAHQMLRKDYETLKTSIPGAQNYAEIPQENKLWIQIDTKDDKSIFEGTLSEIIKQVLANETYRSKVTNPSPKQVFDPAALASYQPQQTKQPEQKPLNALLVSPYGNQQMPGYAIIGTKELSKEEIESQKQNEAEEKETLNKLIDQRNQITQSSNELRIPNALFSLFLISTDVNLFDKYKNKLPELISNIQQSLINPLYRENGINNSIVVDVESEDVTEYQNYQNPNDNVKALYENEKNKILQSIDKFLKGSNDTGKISIKDDRVEKKGATLESIPPYKLTYFPIRVESAIYTYSDKLPVDIYLNNKLIRKGFPNNSYFKLDPREFELTKGPHELKILDNRPGMPQNMLQSRMQRFEFRLEPEKEAIVFNVEPNRIIR